MTRMRAMTLLEVLASTALLSLVVGVCLPMLTTGAARTDGNNRVQVENLSWAVDRVMGESERHGLDFARMAGSPVIRTESPSGTLDVRLRLLRPAGQAETDHAWIVFESGGVAVSRWIAVPNDRGEP